MGLQQRSMQPKDVAECADIIERHPVIGPRYGPAIADLREAWLRLLACQAHGAGIIEEVTESSKTICFVGVSVFVGDEFVREIKASPLRWIGPELARRIMRGDSPVHSDNQLRGANSSCGMNLVVWEGCIRPGYEQHPEIHRKIINLFLQEHRGYLWKEAIAGQFESVERLRWTLDTGGLLWNAELDRYLPSFEGNAQELIKEPHVVGVTREIERGRPGTWIGALFDYHPPRIGLSPSEQRLLLAAISGSTDQELSDYLGISLSTVKNTWRSIYNRAMSRLPELFPDSAPGDFQTSERGKEKRRRLLAHLREHPEELRPVSH
ncbi:MAG: helix-turn-helix transcriptional regulator, partial [Candidatus Acidiferrales bacterium]